MQMQIVIGGIYVDVTYRQELLYMNNHDIQYSTHVPLLIQTVSN